VVTHFCIPRTSRVAGLLNDLYRFSPTSNTWTALNIASPPSARYGMGFSATPDGMLYVFGGDGNRGEGSLWVEEWMQQYVASVG
jgi:N-acetylneuraminic acid mutarotase